MDRDVNLMGLIADLQAALTGAQRDAEDAAKWRELMGQCQERGFGPGLTPSHVAGFVPNIARITEIVVASQPPDVKSGPASRKGVKLGPRKPRANGHEAGAAAVEGEPVRAAAAGA